MAKAERQHAYYARNIERLRAKNRARQQQYRAQSPEKARATVNKYRASRKDFFNSAARLRRALLRSAHATRPAPAACEVCAASAQRIVLDHDHVTGDFRGWLCDRCNLLLGKAHDSPELLENLAGYLRRAGGVP